MRKYSAADIKDSPGSLGRVFGSIKKWRESQRMKSENSWLGLAVSSTIREVSEVSERGGRKLLRRS